MKQKGFAPLIIILVIAILGVVGYFGYKNYLSTKNKNVFIPPIFTGSDPTLNWEAYSDTKNNFLFRYPNNFVNKTTNDDNIYLKVGNENLLLILRLDSDFNKYTKLIDEIILGVDANEPGVSVRNIGSYIAYLQSIQSSGGEFSFSRTIIIPTESQIIEISVLPKDENNFVSAEKLADQVFSTIKFTK